MAFSGTAGSVVLNSGGTPVIDDMAEWSLDPGLSTNDITAFGDDWAKILPSIRSFTGSFSGNSNGGTVQQALREAIFNGTSISLYLYQSDTEYFTIGTAYVTGMTSSISQTGKGDTSFNFTGSDALTYSDA